MKTFIVIAVLLATTIPSATSSIRRFIVKNEVFMGRQVPEFCMDYFESSSAKLKTENINRELISNALDNENDWQKQEQNFILQATIQELALKKYADHICDASEFAPTILSADYQYTCVEICQSCMPGSAPICFQRNPRFTGLAQVCLCTYNLENPIDNAAFSLRHEKRVFSRKIRRT
ncbi:DUF19 domain-containing protein [Caenorhabditis elegans]|uniref:DUF19 domain-containing protein n=1 Tax=Caenorhabditis elegans TaxID=6239 RepID=Q965T5_CAEEL|nr:DUF19 domain-containing protein [Caenorhabditis elegans]CCD73792.1 DUF19 domain-containing protein [Caenorhabditis elegans]|eukprot:NP_497179.1 Uncharacterized protein CELE_Y50D7A.5 [Caenorhabditis elegans]